MPRGVKKDVSRTERNTLVVENIGLVYFVIKKHFSYFAYRRGIPYNDLVGYGTEGLIRAADKYDPLKGELSTYAPWWIRQTIQRMVQSCEYIIRIPVHRADEFAKKRRESEYREQQALVKGEEPMMIENGFFEFGMISLDDVGRVKDGRDRHEIIPSSLCSPEEQVMSIQKSEQEKERISILQECLAAPDWYVLSRRWGINRPDSRGVSLEKIGIELGVTRERVRQIEVRALKRAQKILKGR